MPPPTIRPLLALATVAAGLAALPGSAAAWSLSTTTTTTTTSTGTEQVPVATDAGCSTLATRQAFGRFNDAAQYFTAPGGSFESGSLAWKLENGAKIISSNENIGVQSGSKALELPVGATATSPEFCVDETNPSFRFAAKLSSLDGGYQAIVVYRDSAGQATKTQFTSSSDGTYYNGDTSWNPSAISPLATSIPLVQGGATATVQLQFVGTTKSYGRWVGAKAYIDSVMVDPYRRG